MAQKEKQQKGVWPMCASGGGNPLSVYVFLLALLLLSLTHTTHSFIKCRVTNEDGGFLQPQNSVDDAVKNKTTTKSQSSFDFCFVVYNIDGEDKTIETTWKLKPYTYVAGGSGNAIGVCKTPPIKMGGCQIENTTKGGAWRVDFVCCCESNSRDGCNAEGSAMDPQYQFKVQLEQSNNQICRVDYAKDKRINDCSRLSGQKETAATPSRCWSVLKGDDWVLGCALDKGGKDRCSWAAKYTEVKSGVCRLNAKKNVECCCLGKYCNGKQYMNLTCRAETKKWSNHWNFTYGVPGCGVAWPKKTTPSPITANPDNTTTTGGSSSTLLIVGLIVGVIVLLLICIVVAVGIFVYCKKKRRNRKEGQGVADPNGANDQKGAAGVDQKDAGAVEPNDAVGVDAVNQGPASTDPNLGGSDANMKNQ